MSDTPDITFLDVETMGLDIAAPVWEFAAIRRESDGCWICNNKIEMFIQHDPAHWLDDPDWPDSMKADYRARFDPATALPEVKAAEIIASYVDGGAVIHASNPGFDMERLERLLRRNGIEPGWHYHPVDVPTLAQGYLAARRELPEGPWKSDTLSKAAGVDPADYDRHTALGDVLWTQALYDIVMGTEDDDS